MSGLRKDPRVPVVALVATTLLLAGILAAGTWLVIDEIRQQRDQAALVDETSREALEQRLDDANADLERGIGAINAAADDLITQITASELDGNTALSAAVIDGQIGRTLPAVDRVIYQDAVAQVFGVDEFGSPTASPTDSGYDSNIANRRPNDQAFADRQGQVYLEDGIAAYYPIPDSGGWLVLILSGNVVAGVGQFVELSAEDVAPAFEVVGDVGNLRTSATFLDSRFVGRSQVEIPTEKPGWLPLILRALGALAALAGAAALAKIAFGNHREAQLRREARLAGGAVGAGMNFDANIIGFVELDDAGLILGANQAYCEMVGKEHGQLIGKSLISLTEPADKGRHLGALDKVISGAVAKNQVEHRITTDSGSETWVLEHLSKSDNGESSRIMVQTQDITFRRYATWELAKQALHDELTGLANRAMLVHRLRTSLSGNAEREAAPTEEGDDLVGVMFIDVDRFKLVNDSLGHDVGDRLIKHVASRLESAARAGDTVSRFGGDEFVVLCDSLSGVGEVLAVAERIRAAVATPFTDKGATVHPTLSIGIALANVGEMTADELLGDADAAMYRAKERGRNRVEVFDEGMRKLVVEQMTLENELREAIEHGEIAMYYQPIVNSQDYATAGFEALLRWPHPTRGLLTPGQFLGVAEEAGLQGRLDTAALTLTCQQMARWAAKYPHANNLYVSANKVPKNFPQFVQQIREIVASTGLPPGLLVVEVVENVLLDDADGALQAIESLKAMGVRVAIDDFGTGYSSLSYLTQFKPTTLKIDRAFVSLLPEDQATASVVQAITEMALALDITVVAEGVETWEQAEALNRMGVPYFQGYLFAKPRPAEEIESWFQSNQLDSGGVAPASPDGRYAVTPGGQRSAISIN